MWEGAPSKPVYTIIWTTTPWTLPASLAVAFHPEMEYVALNTPDAVYIVAQALLSEVIVHAHLMSAANPSEPASQADILALFKGTALDGATFQHPFLDRTVLGVNATYVTADQGTGAVHTAPAHGVDDFATGKRYNLPEVQYVDDSGRQMHTERFGGGQPQPYEGLTVFKSNPVIIELLKEKGALLAATSFEHSYPHCWRCHNPVITRATEQWFIAMDTPMPAPDGSETTFRQRALDEIKTVTWDPAWGQERITNMVATRPDWCISRQRIWGVPIAVFLCRKCGEPLNDPAVNKPSSPSSCASPPTPGTSTPPKISFPPAPPATAAIQSSARRWTSSTSGSSPAPAPTPSSTSTPTPSRSGHPTPPTRPACRPLRRGRRPAPRLVHVLAALLHRHAQPRPFKMSPPTAGRSTKKAAPSPNPSATSLIRRDHGPLGGDIVRLWVASVDFREDVVASLPLLRRLAEEIYRKLRNTFRFLLGSLAETDPATGETHAFDPRPIADGGDAVRFAQMQPIDQYILNVKQPSSPARFAKPTTRWNSTAIRTSRGTPT